MKKFRCSIWQPVPPPGYVALGCFVTRDKEDPKSASVQQHADEVPLTTPRVLMPDRYRGADRQGQIESHRVRTRCTAAGRTHAYVARRAVHVLDAVSERPEDEVRFRITLQLHGCFCVGLRVREKVSPKVSNCAERTCIKGP